MELDNRHSILQTGLVSFLQCSVRNTTIQIHLVHNDGRMRLLCYRIHHCFHDAVQTARRIMEPNARTLQTHRKTGVRLRQYSDGSRLGDRHTSVANDLGAADAFEEEDRCELHV